MFHEKKKGVEETRTKDTLRVTDSFVVIFFFFLSLVLS